MRAWPALAGALGSGTQTVPDTGYAASMDVLTFVWLLSQGNYKSKVFYLQYVVVYSIAYVLFRGPLCNFKLRPLVEHLFLNENLLNKSFNGFTTDANFKIC